MSAEYLETGEDHPQIELWALRLDDFELALRFGEVPPGFEQELDELVLRALEAGQSQIATRARLALGAFAPHFGDHPRAVELLEEVIREPWINPLAVTTYAACSTRMHASGSHWSTARVTSAAGDYDLARRSINHAIALLADTEDITHLARARLLAAEIALWSEDYAAARQAQQIQGTRASHTMLAEAATRAHRGKLKSLFGDVKGVPKAAIDAQNRRFRERLQFRRFSNLGDKGCASPLFSTTSYWIVRPTIRSQVRSSVPVSDDEISRRYFAPTRSRVPPIETRFGTFHSRSHS